MSLAQDSGNISEVRKRVDENGLAQARIGVRTSSQPGRKETPGVPQQDAIPALSLFYSEGFKLIRGDSCGVTLRNENTTLIAHSPLVQEPPPDQRYIAELFIPLNKLSVKKAKDHTVTARIQTKLNCLEPGEQNSKATGHEKTLCSHYLLRGIQ